MREQQRQPVSTPCTQWQAKLTSLHRNDLLPYEHEALNAHLQECSACTQTQEDYQAMYTAIRCLPPVTPLPQLPEELAEVIHQQQRGIKMLKKGIPIRENTGNLEVIDMDKQSAKSTHKGQYKSDLALSPERQVSHPIRIISSLVAVLVVAILAGGAFLLFTARSGPEVSVVGGSVPLQAKVLYTSPELPGQVKQANIYAVNTQNGSVYWRATLKTKLVTSELIPHEGTLFAPGYDGTLYALSAKTGQILWKYSVMNNPTSGQTADSENDPSSPITDGDTVYFSTNNGFYALNIHDGKLLWFVKTPTSCKLPAHNQKDRTANACIPILSIATNGKVYGFFDGLYAFDAHTGKQLWHDPQPQFRGSQSVVVSDKYLYTIADSRLKIIDAANGKPINIPELSLPGYPVSLFGANGFVYYSTDTQLTALQGTKVRWKQAHRNVSPIAFSRKTLFIESTFPLDSTSQLLGTYFYALDADTGKIKWHWGEKSSNGNGTWGPGYPTSSDGRLYFFFAEDSSSSNYGLWILHDGKRDFYPLPG